MTREQYRFRRNLALDAYDKARKNLENLDVYFAHHEAERVNRNPEAFGARMPQSGGCAQSIGVSSLNSARVDKPGQLFGAAP